ncbi:MAG: sulfatase-like hydrolase/transferase [Bdellovibrionales bacterium]
MFSYNYDFYFEKEGYIYYAGEYLFFLGACLLTIQLLKLKKPLISAAPFFAGIIWLLYFRAFSDFLAPIGIDSLAESTNFDYKEALFYLKTLYAQVKPQLGLFKFTISVAIALTAYALHTLLLSKIFLKKPLKNITLCLSISFMGASLYLLYKDTVSQFIQASSAYIDVSKHFDNPATKLQTSQNPPKLVVYIGESTSAMHMGAYSYFRDTTPKIDDLVNSGKNTLLFKNVFSTHTHTTPSLLEALSTGIDKKEDLLPIHKRNRISLISTLHENNFKTHLLSNQGQSGTYNQVSSVIFKNSQKKFSRQNRLLGNNDRLLKKPFDHIFFNKELPRLLNKKERSVIFLHSYAGHGSYLKNIPSQFRKPVDNYFKDLSPEAISGDIPTAAPQVDAYDSAIKYVDYSLHQAIKKVQAAHSPTIFIYFADHGDSPFTGRGHDSSRLTHEMMRVPFLVYFNDSALSAYQGTFNELTELAKKNMVTTLAKLPYFIFKTLQTRLPAGPALSKEPSPIVIRDVADQTTFINLAKKDFDSSSIEKPDDATKVFKAQHHASSDLKICYHRSNTIAQIVRGSFATNCIETDLNVTKDKELLSFHPPLKSTGLSFKHITKALKKSKRYLWLDLKNIDSAKNCKLLKEALIPYSSMKDRILLEFPNTLSLADYENLNCLKDFLSNNWKTSYYINTKNLLQCVKKDKSSCTKVKNTLTLLLKDKTTSHISFDYRGLKVIKRFNEASSFKWNTWNVKPEQFNRLNQKAFDYIILKTGDPNLL